MDATRIARFMAVAMVSMVALTSIGVYAAPDDAKGREILKQAKPLADNGDANAQYNLGVLYDEGLGVDQDYDKALKWYRKAAAQEYAKAEHNIGIMYQEGHGVNKDPEEASRWFEKAAKHGEPAAQNNLAVMYVRGQGVDPDLGKAAYWSALAARAGNESAQTNLPMIVEELPKSRIEGDHVNIRDDSNKRGQVVRQADSDTSVVMLAQKDDWIRVLFPDDYTVGWVAGFLLADNGKPVETRQASVQTETKPSADPQVTSQTTKQVARQTSQAEPAGPKPAASGQQTSEEDEQADITVDSQPRDEVGGEASEEISEEMGGTQASADDSEPAVDASASEAAETQTAEQAPEPAGLRLRVASATVNVREAPSSSAAVAFKARHNEMVTELDRRGGWHKVRFDDGRTGWMAGFLLKKKK